MFYLATFDKKYMMKSRFVYNLRDRRPEFSKMKIFFGTSVSDTLKPVDYDGPNRFSQIDSFLCYFGV